MPDALIVPDSWFDDWYQRVSLYFFDPTAEVLVARAGLRAARRPVRLLARRAACSTPAVRRAADVVRTLLPAGHPRRPLGADHAAAASPRWRCPATPPRSTEDTASGCSPSWRGRCGRSSGSAPCSSASAARRSASAEGSPQVQPRRRRRLRPQRCAVQPRAVRPRRRPRRDAARWAPSQDTLGPLGQRGPGLRSIGVNLAGSRVAGVSGDGTELYRRADRGARRRGRPRGHRRRRPRARPRWDYRDRIWVLDRGAGRASVSRRGRRESRRRVGVPGVTGRDRHQLLVSRDGSRLVAVVRGRKADRVVASRVRHDEAGQRPRLHPAAGPAAARGGQPAHPRHRLALADLHLGAERHHRRPRRRCARSRSTGRPARSGDRRHHPAARAASGRSCLARSTAARCTPSPAGRSCDLDPPRAHRADAARGPDRRSPTSADLHRPARGRLPAYVRGCCDGRVLDEALDLFLGSRCVGCDAPGPDAVPGVPGRAVRPGRASRWPTPVPAGLVAPWATRVVRRRRPRARRGPQGPRPVGPPAGARRPARAAVLRRDGRPRPRRAGAAGAGAVASGCRARSAATRRPPRSCGSPPHASAVTRPAARGAAARVARRGATRRASTRAAGRPT